MDAIIAFLEALNRVGVWFLGPPVWAVALGGAVLSAPITFLAVQTMKIQRYKATGQEYHPARIQRCSWAWYAVISTIFQELLYWGGPSQVPWNIWLGTTVLGVVTYVGTIEWWIDLARERWPRVWARIRTRKELPPTRRRASDRAPAPAATAEDLGIRNPIRVTDPDSTNH